MYRHYKTMNDGTSLVYRTSPQIFELPSASSSSGDNKNLNFEFSISLVQDYLHFVLLSIPEGAWQWDIGSLEWPHSRNECPQLWQKIVFGVTPFRVGQKHCERTSLCPKVEDRRGHCKWSWTSDTDNSNLRFLLSPDEELADGNLGNFYINVFVVLK